MGVALGHIFSDRYPLQFVSEQVLVLPQKMDLRISSVGWPKILYFFSGSAEMALESGETYRLVPGETVILSGPHGQRYLARNSPTPVRLHALILSFERPRDPSGIHTLPNWDADLTRYLAEAFPENRHLASSGASSIWDLAVRLRNECESSQPMHEELVGELARLFALRVAEFAGIHQGATLPKRFCLARRACDGALQGRVPRALRDQTAESLGVSIATLDRACRESVGMPYASYVDRIAIERAKSMLLSSSLPIFRIAKELHFGSARTFCRAFKSATGLTPGNYQQRFQDSRALWSDSAKRNLVRRSAAERGLPEGKSWRLVALPACLETAKPSLLLCLKGAFRAAVGGAQWEMHEEDGAVLLLPGGKTAECHPLKPGRAVAVVIEGSADWKAFDNPQKTAVIAMAAALEKEGGRLQPGSELPLLRAWLGEASASLHASLSIRSLLGALWWEVWGALLKAFEGDSASPHAPGHNHRLLISHAKEFIQKHFDRDLTLGEIAWSVGVSEEHLARVFRAEAHETVMGFRLGRRIHKAQIALVRTQMPISEIAESAGFSSVAHFYRVFKKHLGCTPGAFRKKGVGALP